MGRRGKAADNIQQGLLTGLGGVNALQNKFLSAALDDYSALIKQSITTQAGKITQQNLAIQQGFAAEAHHVGSYNIEAAAAGANNHRATLNVGQRNDPVTDARIHSPGASKDYQLKFYKDGASSAKAFQHDRYADVNKLVPEDQLNAARATARREMLRNQENRPGVSRNYEKTAKTLDDGMYADDRPDIRSKPLQRQGKGSSEELVQQARKDGKGPEYAGEASARNRFNSMQYANAAKAGALGGSALAAASEMIDLMSSDAPLTREQCMRAAEQVVIGAIKGAGNAILVTGIQHLGQSLVDTSGSAMLKTGGRHLLKGSVAAAAANIAVSLGQSMYQFSQGEIDSVEFAGSAISNTVSVVGGAIAYGAGTATATFLGQWVAAEVASTAVLGTTLGALGPIALGVTFSIGFSFALAAYVSHFSQQGTSMAMRDIQGAMAELNGGKINLSQYAGTVGTMADFTFEWKDVLPFSGSIAVFSEYRTRKQQLMSLQRDVASRMASLPEEERQMMAQIMAAYQQQEQRIDQDYQRMRAQLKQQAGERYAMLSGELDAYLEMRYLLFTPLRRTQVNARAEVSAASNVQLAEQRRVYSYREQLQRLSHSLESAGLDGGDTQQIRQYMLATISVRLSEVLPTKTAWDRAYEFLALPSTGV